MKKKILFIDRDGTIIREPQPSQQVDRLEKFEFVPGAIGALAQLVAESDYRLVLVSNQDGLGTPSFPREAFEPLQELMIRTLEGEGVEFDEVLIDESMPADNAPTRKPRTGMVAKFMNELLDRERSFVIGDRATDMQLAANMGIGGVLLGDLNDVSGGVGVAPVFAGTSWAEIRRFLMGRMRRATVCRMTSETDITVALDLDGSGLGDIATGIGFFDHMLDQIARHGVIDLCVRATGDLHVDEHHTIEDVAISLGECLRAALGAKKGIGRYGSAAESTCLTGAVTETAESTVGSVTVALPMDESRAEVLLDLGGRAHLEWSATFEREFVGDFPTEMTRHFFESFCSAAACNMHVSASGDNTHHKIEGIFKAFARALRQAVRSQGGAIGVPSTKGLL